MQSLFAMTDPFSKLFDDYPLMQGTAAPPKAASATSSSGSLGSVASLFALPGTPVAAKTEKKIRRLPREIIKKGRAVVFLSFVWFAS